MVPTTITGVIDNITYHNEDNGFCVFRLLAGDDSKTIVVGNLAQAVVGESIECFGIFQQDKRFGKQFKAQNIRVTLPKSEKAIKAYLASSHIKGIGLGFAEKIVAKFGANSLTILDSAPNRLLEVPGIGKGKMQTIIDSWAMQKHVAKIIMFFNEYGLSSNKARAIYKKYGSDAINTIQADPYKLVTDIKGISFKIADNLAKNLNIGLESKQRIYAAIAFLMQEDLKNGNTAILHDKLVYKAKELLELTEDLIDNAIDDLIANEKIVSDLFNNEPCLFLPQYYQYERKIAYHLKRLSSKQSFWSNLRYTDKLWQNQNIELSKSQIAAVNLVLSNKVAILTGGPGVGKTTVINTVLQIIKSKTDNIALCAPTGRAAKRMSEVAGEVAKTIHRLLEFDKFKFNYNSDNKLPYSFIIIDEASMLDVNIAYALLSAIDDKAHIIFVGDDSQLPSVGPGTFLKSLIESNNMAKYKLTEIFRQAQTSQIVVSAHKINQGLVPNIINSEESDCFFIQEENQDKILPLITELAVKRIPKKFSLNAKHDIQILTPMNKGVVGVIKLNHHLQDVLIKNKDKKITANNYEFYPGDKVIQTVNNYDLDVYNGDIGFVKEVNNDTNSLMVDFDGNLVVYENEVIKNLNLAYAITIHKSQGSEYPCVIIPLTTAHNIMLERNLIYTALTRGKALVVMVGSKNAFKEAVKRERANTRVTTLIDKINDVF